MTWSHEPVNGNSVCILLPLRNKSEDRQVRIVVRTMTCLGTSAEQMIVVTTYEFVVRTTSDTRMQQEQRSRFVVAIVLSNLVTGTTVAYYKPVRYLGVVPGTTGMYKHKRNQTET